MVQQWTSRLTKLQKALGDGECAKCGHGRGIHSEMKGF